MALKTSAHRGYRAARASVMSLTSPFSIYGRKTGIGGISMTIRHRVARCGMPAVTTSKLWPSIRTKTIRTMAMMMKPDSQLHLRESKVRP